MTKNFFALSAVILALTLSTVVGATPATTVNLMSYLAASIQTPPDTSSIPKYNRAQQFGGWVHQDPNHHCYNTREMVLARDEDPIVPIKFKENNCSIATGLWHEPYTGTDVLDSADLQIDHVVPLKAAYYSGAYDWSGPIRCNYANYLGNNFHLLTVSGHENMSKGDRSPDGYLPPNENELCDYVSKWMKIKIIWQLTASAAEVRAIQDVIHRENCGEEFLFITNTELADQRLKASTPIEACRNFAN